MLKYLIACILGILISYFCSGKVAAAETINVTSITSKKNGANVEITVKADVSGLAASTDYRYRLVAVRNNTETVIDGNTKLKSNADGTYSYMYNNTGTGLAFQTEYEFQLKVFNEADNPATATPLAVGKKKHTTASNTIDCSAISCQEATMDNKELDLSSSWSESKLYEQTD